MKILITTTKRWIAPGSIALVLYFLCSRLSSQNFSREYSTVPINVEENIIERRYNTRNGITIAFTVCGDIIRLEQALVMLKSAVLFSQAKLEVHIFADSHLQPEFRNKLSRWPEKILKNLSYHIHNISFPDNDESADGRDWKTIYRPCATQRLFFAKLLTKVDALIYVDIDVLFLAPPEELWNYFYRFNTSQEMAASRTKVDVDPNDLKTHIPVLTKNEFNSGVMLFNLTRMRTSTFSESIYQYRKQYGKVIRGDQDLLNIYRSYNPDRLYYLPCEWNFLYRFCRPSSKQQCLVAEETGPRLLHATNFRFLNKKTTSMFQALYKAFDQFDLDLNVVSDLILFVDAHMAGVTTTECGQKSVFMKQVHERSKSLNK